MQRDLRQRSSDCVVWQTTVFLLRNHKEACPYLMQCEVSLDLGRQTLRVQGEKVPLFPMLPQLCLVKYDRW
ncbi:hypothetical protein E2C01_039109 [Portunus trituberculatus]|uniref:Uncharacterized protein n=1 Tax=Portunus trituberculatus TaxID=210409 RepID=A0A5B7FDX4_PORTR|nr:hypothetical protein [Portunus trituberculatus]